MVSGAGSAGGRAAGRGRELAAPAGKGRAGGDRGGGLQQSELAPAAALANSSPAPGVRGPAGFQLPRAAPAPHIFTWQLQLGQRPRR